MSSVSLSTSNSSSNQVFVARAPARLDVIGGIADYSGSLVLESTLACGTTASVRLSDSNTISISSTLLLTGDSFGVHMPISIFHDADGGLLSFEQANSTLTSDKQHRWSAYAAGCIYVLLASGWLESTALQGMDISISSDVPLGAGVSSSASMEVAVMFGVAGAFGIQMDGMEVARLCQIVENRVVGAPCGIMDQVTCSLGKANSLLALECRPHNLLGNVAIPKGWSFSGIDSGVKHSVGGSKYGRARIGAFMGLQIVRFITGRNLDYLCELSPSEWSTISDQVPEHLSGAEFFEKRTTYPDPISKPTMDETYSVRLCTEHPILENARVAKFRELLETANESNQQTNLIEAGKLMYEAHQSYSDRVDLGCPETDKLVRICQELGPECGVFGAKITGGGSGGCVAILCSTDGVSRLEEIAQKYREATGRKPSILTGSSDGAAWSHSG
ncbi:MAG: GHMP kinase [Chthonomonadales bacterium]